MIFQVSAALQHESPSTSSTTANQRNLLFMNILSNDNKSLSKRKRYDVARLNVNHDAKQVIILSSE